MESCIPSAHEATTSGNLSSMSPSKQTSPREGQQSGRSGSGSLPARPPRGLGTLTGSVEVPRTAAKMLFSYEKEKRASGHVAVRRLSQG